MYENSSLQSFALAVALVVLLFTSGCGSVKEVKAGMDRNGKEIQLQQSEVLSVRLESNPTTGYSWQLAECEKSILQPAGEPTFETAANGKQQVGTGGWETFQFKPVKAGQTHLKLVYLRPWEKGVEPAQTFEAEVTIH